MKDITVPDYEEAEYEIPLEEEIGGLVEEALWRRRLEVIDDQIAAEAI